MKKCLLVCLFLCGLMPQLFAQTAFNFDTASDIDIKDLIYYISWLQAEKTSNVSTVVARAMEIYPAASGPLSRLPDESSDDLNGDGVADIKDLIFMISWIQAEKISDFTIVENRALEIWNGVGSLSKLPGTPIGGSTVPVTITGIQLD